jgi:hypothetical protein
VRSVTSVSTVLTVLTVLTVPTGCSVTPLTNKIKVGEESFVVGVGEGSDSMTDLYAAPARGGVWSRVTFNRGVERLPKLSPDGIRVAFLRRSNDGDPWSLVVLDLQNNREASAPVPKAVGEPEALGWADGGSQVVVRGAGSLVSPVPPRALWLRSVSLDSIRWADTATSELLGDPPTARIAVCPEGSCVVSGSDTTRLEGATGAIRWGADSLAYMGSTGWEIRPLAGGRVRRPEWTGVPANLREISYYEVRGER